MISKTTSPLAMLLTRISAFNGLQKSLYFSTGFHDFLIIIRTMHMHNFLPLQGTFLDLRCLPWSLILIDHQGILNCNEINNWSYLVNIIYFYKIKEIWKQRCGLYLVHVHVYHLQSQQRLNEGALNTKGLIPDHCQSVVTVLLPRKNESQV